VELFLVNPDTSYITYNFENILNNTRFKKLNILFTIYEKKIHRYPIMGKFVICLESKFGVLTITVSLLGFIPREKIK